MIKAIWNNSSLSRKITLSVVFVALMTGVAISSILYYLAKDKLTWEMDMRNQVIAQDVAASFKAYLDARSQSLAGIASSEKTYNDFTGLESANATLESSQSDPLQKESAEKQYQNILESVNDGIGGIVKSTPFIDVYFINKNGKIVYHNANNKDINQNISSGQFSGTALDEVFTSTLKRNDLQNKAFFSDFKINPLTKKQALYLSYPIQNQQKENIGVVVGELDMKTVFQRANIADMEDTVAYIIGQKNYNVLTDIDVTSENETENNAKLESSLVSDIFSESLVARGKGVIYPDAYFQSKTFEFDGKKITFISERNALTFQDGLNDLRNLSFLVLLACLGVSCVMAILISRSLSQPILNLKTAVTDMLEGKEVDLHEKQRGDEIGGLAETLEAVYTAGRSAQKVQIALDNAQSPLMMFDQNLKINYVNKALQESMNKSKDFIHKNCPQVNMSQWIGIPFSAFDPNGTQGINRVGNLTGFQVVSLKLGERAFDVGVTPILNAKGQNEGYISEWIEKTQEYLSQKEKEIQQAKEKEIEEEVARVIGIVARGDFSARLKLNDNRPFIQSLANNINGLCEVVESFVDTASKSLQAVASGDLTQTINARYEGRLAEMQDSINSTIYQLSSTLNQIASLGQSIRTATSDISSGAEDLSSRTESQAASIQETVATMEEMSASVRMNADNAGKANTLSREALQQAKTGGDVVSSAVNAMKQLESSSVRITEIVNVIDSIASQTNLLALNAAVEAARAGEAGKGFAVVASEVRSLASRCADAAHDIRELIMQSNGHVGEGVKLVNATGESLMAIVKAVENVAQTISAISSASREQATGVEEISHTITQMDEMTQQNASLSDESAAASRNLLAQASELSELVNYFKTGATSGSLSRAGQMLQKERGRQWG